jgi:hypothetical protein
VLIAAYLLAPASFSECTELRAPRTISVALDTEVGTQAGAARTRTAPAGCATRPRQQARSAEAARVAGRARVAVPRQSKAARQRLRGNCVHAHGCPSRTARRKNFLLGEQADHPAGLTTVELVQISAEPLAGHGSGLLQSDVPFLGDRQNQFPLTSAALPGGTIGQRCRSRKHRSSFAPGESRQHRWFRFLRNKPDDLDLPVHGVLQEAVEALAFSRKFAQIFDLRSHRQRVGVRAVWQQG